MRGYMTIVLLIACGIARAAETYVIDPNHTHATFSFQHLGLSTFQGKIPAQSGTIMLDPQQKRGSVEVVFAPASVATGVPKFDEHLRSKDFFNVEKDPTASFEASRITFQGEAPATIVGDLTIKGVSKPVTLTVTSFHCGQHPMMKVPACGANAVATIKRSDYGMTYALPAVKDEIQLDIEIEATQKK